MSYQKQTLLNLPTSIARMRPIIGCFREVDSDSTVYFSGGMGGFFRVQESDHMTEQEWSECIYCWAKLEFLRGRISHRKLWAFACASARDLSQYTDLGAARWASVELAERYLEGRASEEEAKESWCFSWNPRDLDPWDIADGVRLDAYYILNSRAQADVGETANGLLLRDIVGNPFRSIALDPACLTPSIVCLAQAAYSEGTLLRGELDGTRLAVLADALEEAGCNEHAFLCHLRGPGPHVRGCWPVDLIVEKE
jgi:hypothetical protein